MTKITHFTETEIAEFNDIYRQELSKFISDNYLALKEIRSFGCETVYSINSLKDSDSYTHHDFKALQKNLLSYSLKKISYPHFPFRFQKEYYHQKFIEKFYSILTPKQIEMYEHPDFIGSPDCVLMTKTFYQQPDILYKYLQKYISTQFNIKSHHNDVEDMLKIWKDTFDISKFNTLVIQLFTEHSVSIKKVKKYLQLTHFLIDSLVDDIEIKKKLRNIFPLTKNINPFVQTDSIWYEVLIDKKKLEQIVILPNKDAYNSMHQDIFDSLKNIKLQLGIEEIQLDNLFKKKPIGSILVKIGSNCSYDKNKFEEFLLISYHGYANLYHDNSLLKGVMTKYLTYEWFMKNYLENSIPLNSSSSPKNKI